MFKLFPGLISFLLCQIAVAQTNSLDLTHPEIGIQMQFYPAGIIPTLTATIPQSSRISWYFRLGGNITDRKDFSPVNDHEEGIGYGGSVGLQRHFALKKGEIRAGLNCDVWNMKIKWENNQDNSLATSGTSNILVLQPWIHGGYYFRPGDNRMLLSAGIGLGREINAVTTGREVAQGWMGSLFAGIAFRLN